MEILGYRLVQTCFGCPEQYDVFNGEGQVGYLRLRHGVFRADYPDCGGETVFSAYPNGDGIFEDDERMYYLTEAVKKLREKHEGVDEDTSQDTVTISRAEYENLRDAFYRLEGLEK